MSMYKESQFWLRVTLTALAGALFLLVHSIYWPVVISLILTFILMPMRNLFMRLCYKLTNRRLPADIAILLSFFTFILVMTGLTNVILKPLLYQLNLLAANFNNLVAQTAALVNQLENEQTQFYIPEQIKVIINDAFVKVGNYGVEGVTNLIRSVFVIAGTVVEFFVVPFITFYFMKDGGRMVRSFVNIYPEHYRPQLAVVFDEIHTVLSRYIRGQLLMSCIIATLTFLGMWAMGVPYPMVIGFVDCGYYRVGSYRRTYRGSHTGYPAGSDCRPDLVGQGPRILRHHSADRQPPHHAAGHGGSYQPPSRRHRHRAAHRRHAVRRGRHDTDCTRNGGPADFVQAFVVLQYV